MSRTACSGSAVESTIIALSPPVSAMSGASGARCAAIARSMSPGSFGRAGEAHTVDARIGRERCSHRCAIARQQLHRSARDAGLVHEANPTCRDEGRLLGWLRDDRIAGGKSTENLAREDREREVPGRDAGDHAPRGRARTGT